MVTDPPPTENKLGLTRRTMLKLTSVSALGTGSVAGCLDSAGAVPRRVGYGGVSQQLSSSASFSVIGPGDGLVAHWPLDGTSETVSDIAGGNNGTVRGTPQQGVAGVYDSTAYAFGSTPDDYVEVVDASALAPDELTFGGWFRTDSGANAQTLIQKADARFGVEGYAVEVQTPNSLRAHLAVDSGRASVNPWGVTTHDSEWHHLVCTWDGSSFVMYLDGAEVGRDDSQSGQIVHSSRSMYVGRGDNGYTSYYAMDGSVDDIRVYNTALTETQVATIVDGTTSDEPTPTDPEPPTVPNDEFGENGFGIYGYGGGDGSEQ